MADTFFSPLSSLISTEQIPDSLSFVSDALDTLLDQIRFRNYQTKRSLKGLSFDYDLELIANNALQLDIFNTGLVLSLNPDFNNPANPFSVIPVSLIWNWPILQFIDNFKLLNFSYGADAFYDLIFKAAQLPDNDLLSYLVYAFIDDPNPLDVFVTNANSKYSGLNIPYPLDPDQQTAIANTLAAIAAYSGITFHQMLLVDYILDMSDLPGSLQHVDQLFYPFLGYNSVSKLTDLLVPHIAATVEVTAGLEFPRSWLIPVKPNGEIETDTNIKTTLLFDAGDLYFDSKVGFGFNDNLTVTFPSAYPTAQIANTGITIGFKNAKLDFSTTTNIPEANAAGYPVDFVGVYVQQATIGLNQFGSDDPDNPSASITAKNLLIGTGGISGTIAVVDNGILHRKFGSFSVELDSFSLTFRQNTITNCDIAGAITLDKYTTNGQPSKITITAHIKDSGDFSITATPSANFPPISLPGVFDLHIRTLTVGEEQPKGFYVEISGTLDFAASIPFLGSVLPKGINITKLRIWDDGTIDFRGGSLTLAVAFKLKIGPVSLEVSKMSLGSYTRQHEGISRNYCFFGFDGMINTGNAGIEADGNGIKFYFTVDDGPGKPFDCFVRIDSIGIDIAIPAKDPDFILKGHLSVSNPKVLGSAAGSEYAGSVSVSLPKLGVSGSAGMRLDPAIPSYVVDIGLKLSSPILLGSTGLGIYGFRGLIGEHYLPSKSATTPPLPDTASWWDYYKAKNVPDGLEGIELDKFADESGFSLGAGINIATSFDAGFTFSSKLFLLLGLPDVFLIQGQAGILQSRIGLDDKVDPPFSALIAIDSTSFTGDLSVNYNLPSGGSFKGDVFSLQGTLAMAFFFNNASGWYLNLGEDQPTSKRIQANILTLFKGYAYVMLSAKGFKAGAGAGFDFHKSFGPVGVGISASLDLGAYVSFTPIQIGGFIQFTGTAFLKVFWFKLSLSVQIALAVEAPHPFNIRGSLALKIHTPWPLPNVRFQLSVSWTINNDNSPLLVPVPVLQLPDPTTGYFPAAALNIMSQETFPLNYVTEILSGEPVIPVPGSSGWKYDFTDTTAVMQVTIPLDSYIDIELLKPVMPGQAFLGGSGSQLPQGYTELLPPVKGLSNQVKHVYSITGLNIYIWDDNGSGSWVPYHVYEAVTAIVNSNTGDHPIDLGTLPPGYWQFTQPNTYNKIRLLSQTMFSFANGTDTATTNLDGLNFQRKDIFCYEKVSQQNIVNWKGEALNTQYPAGDTVMVGGVSFSFNGLTGSVQTDGAYGNSLHISTLNGSLLIEFPEAVTSFEIDFGANQNDITIFPVLTSHVNADFGQTVAVDTNLAPLLLSSGQQNTSINYNDINQPVNKALVDFTTVHPLDFDGDFLIGSYFQLPDQFLPITTPQFHHEYDAGKGLMYASLFNKSFAQEEVLQMQYSNTDGVVGRWPLNSTIDTTGILNGIISGSPDLVPGFYQRSDGQPLALQPVYSYTSNTDGLVVPFAPPLKVETGSFAFGVTAIFDPYIGGISTLLSKVDSDPESGYRKGYALHLYQQTPGDLSHSYSDPATVPSFDIWLTCYDGLQCSGIKASCLYTLDYTNSKLLVNQYKQILVSVDRVAGTVDIYIDRVRMTSAAIPAELALVDIQPAVTSIDQISYFTESLQASRQDNNITPAGVINEVQVLSNNLNKTIQPVWRPNTTFAVAVTTNDVVNDNQAGAVNHTQIFGFRTAGPVGLFQQQSAVYQNLLQQDKTDEFKLADLNDYIDYDRSFPDAQGRYNLSKPVLFHNPQINLFFTMPYINAMYSDWDSYQGLPEIQSSLQVQLLDPFKNVLEPQLVWSEVNQAIDSTNYASLPQDQQLLFLLDSAASADSCNANPLTINKSLKQGSYQFPDLSPGELYTALFNAVYQPAGQAQQVAEVHKFSFMASIFATFQDQAASFILDDTPGGEKYALYPLNVSFTADQVSQVLLPLLNANPANDSALIAQYAVQYDRIVYGGMKIKAFEPSANTVINPVINTDPGSSNVTLLGIIIRNPEPFNDPKLPASELANTIQPTLTLADSTVIAPDQFINIYSGDTSAVFITNSNMQVSEGSLRVYFRYKIYNGVDYDTVFEDYTSPAISITTG